MEKNANNKVNRWGLELATYNITFQWISGACNKVAYCLSWLVELPHDTQIPINMLSVSNTDGPAFNTKSQTCQCLSMDTPTVQPDVVPEGSKAQNPTPKPLTADRLEVLLQMQKTDPFCKRISKCFSNGKVLQHEIGLFTHRSAILTHYRFRSEVPCFSYTQVLEVHCFSRSLL